jgi:acetolactate synthase-1/2/3 large subunit
MAIMSGAQILVECLRREGVEVVFGYPGGQILPTFDVLYDTTAFKFILTPARRGRSVCAWPRPALARRTW